MSVFKGFLLFQHLKSTQMTSDRTLIFIWISVIQLAVKLEQMWNWCQTNQWRPGSLLITVSRVFVLYINKMPSNKRLGSGVDSERTDNRNREMDTTQPGQEICAFSGFVFNLLSNNWWLKKGKVTKKKKKKNQSDTHTSGQVWCLNLTGGIEEDKKKGKHNRQVWKCFGSIFFSASWINCVEISQMKLCWSSVCKSKHSLK